MKISKASLVAERAFDYVDKSKITEGVLAFMKTIKLGSGSISSVNPHRRYDLYTLLQEYIGNPEFRIKIHDLLIQSGKMTKIENHP